MKIKAKVKKKDLKTLSKPRKCLEIGKDLARVNIAVNILGISMAGKDKKEIKENAKFAEAELRRIGDKYPLSKQALLPSVNGIVRMASSGDAKTLIPVRQTLVLLFAEAERACS